MKLEAIIERYVGGFGRYQLYVLTLVFIMRFPAAVHNIGYVFYAATPGHWCRFQRHYDVINMTEDQWKRFAIPLKDKGKMEYEQCSMFKWANNPTLTADEINQTLAAIIDGSSSLENQTLSCDSWEYDKWTHVADSLVTEWDMVCGRAWMKANIASVYVVGWIIGTNVGGYISDRFGRRTVVVGGATLAVLFGMTLPFCNNYIAFLVIRCFLAASWNGLTLTTFPLSMELVGPEYRSLLTAMYMNMWAVSYIIIPGVAYGLRHWFPFMMALVSPTIVILLVPASLMPESLQWLVAKGRHRQAEATLRKMARWNKKSIPSDVRLSLVEDKLKQRTNILDLFQTPNVRRINVIVGFNWFLNALVYYNISWNADTLHGDLYLNVFISGLLEIPAYLLNVPILQTMGRRWGTSVFTLVVGILYLISIFVSGIGGTVLILAAKFFISMTFTMIWQYSAELYPTVARSTSMGMVNAVARIGTFIAPYMPLLGSLYSAIISVGLCIAGAFSLLFLPETLSTTLPANVQEVEERGKISARSFLHCPCLHRRDRVGVIESINTQADSNKELDSGSGANGEVRY